MKIIVMRLQFRMNLCGRGCLDRANSVALNNMRIHYFPATTKFNFICHTSTYSHTKINIAENIKTTSRTVRK